MESYVITYSTKTSGNLFADYETIEGKNGKEALEKSFNVKVKRAYGEMGKYADFIIVKGYYDSKSNVIKYKGKYSSLCYIIELS